MHLEDTNPTKLSEIGKQCSGKRLECPWDTCNRGTCFRGCASTICTKKGCDDVTKGENQLCHLKRNNCDKGLKCMKQDDGCDNGIGRCIKSGKSKCELDFKKLFSAVLWSVFLMIFNYLKNKLFFYLESQNRTCGFEGGDCCRNELPPGETLPEGVMNCDPGLTCASIKPMPNSPRKCLPTRNYGSQMFLSINHISDLLSEYIYNEIKFQQQKF